HPGHGVGDIGNAPLAGEFFPVGATEATAAPVVDVQEGKAPGGPELDLEIEGGARRRRGAAVAGDHQGRLLPRRATVVGVAGRVVEAVGAVPFAGGEGNGPRVADVVVEGRVGR